jgi:H+/Cl- antiporter ClcA
MTQRRSSQRLHAIYNLGKWLTIGSTIGILSGTASALLRVTLDWATLWREAHPPIVLLLPLGGLLGGLAYNYFGKSVEAGNNLIIAEIHEPQTLIPLRMAPLILSCAIAAIVGHNVTLAWGLSSQVYKIPIDRIYRIR